MTGQVRIVTAKSTGTSKTNLGGATSIMDPFTPLISNKRDIMSQYIRKISGTSWSAYP